MVQFASYLRRVLRKMRLIFPRINGPNVSSGALKIAFETATKTARVTSPLKFESPLARKRNKNSRGNVTPYT